MLESRAVCRLCSHLVTLPSSSLTPNSCIRSLTSRSSIRSLTPFTLQSRRHSSSEIAQLIRSSQSSRDDTTLRSRVKETFTPDKLRLESVTWDSSCRVVEAISRKEAVHPIRHWLQAKGRFAPNRRVFALVHDECRNWPLVALHVALTGHVPGRLSELHHDTLGQMDHSRAGDSDEEVTPDSSCAIYYSISNLEPQLGVPGLGSLLIKLATEELRRELTGIHTFCTLSPIPGFCLWARNQLLAPNSPASSLFPDSVWEDMGMMFEEGELLTQKERRDLLKVYLHEFTLLVAYYIARAKRSDGVGAKCKVAHFHLGNGAQLHRVNPPDLTSAAEPPAGQVTGSRSWEQSLGFMANYMYHSPHYSACDDVYKTGGVPLGEAVQVNLQYEPKALY